MCGNDNPGNAPASNTITAFILPNGDVVLETGIHEGAKHASVNGIVNTLASELGATSRADRKLAHSHAHEHQHDHEHVKQGH